MEIPTKPCVAHPLMETPDADGQRATANGEDPSSSSPAAAQNEATDGEDPSPAAAAQLPLSKSARKKQLKHQMREKRKAERRAAEKERKKRDLERKRRDWDVKLAATPEGERAALVESRREARRERMGRRAEERGARAARLRRAAEAGPKLVLDLEFGHLMAPNEIHSLVHQVMYCYAVNGRSTSPAHLWLTGCSGEIEAQLQRLPGYNKWIIEKETRSYIEALSDQKENMVYLTADSECELHELDPAKIYIIGGLVDRNRWKGITMKKAKEQGIQSAKLPIGGYLKMSSSKILTVNQVVEILLKFLETGDWRAAFFQVIPQRKICEDEPASRTEEAEIEMEEEENGDEGEADSDEDNEIEDRLHEEQKKKMRIEKATSE